MYLSDCLLAGSGTDWLTVNLSSRCTAEGNRISGARDDGALGTRLQTPILRSKTQRIWLEKSTDSRKSVVYYPGPKTGANPDPSVGGGPPYASELDNTDLVWAAIGLTTFATPVQPRQCRTLNTPTSTDASSHYMSPSDKLSISSGCQFQTVISPPQERNPKSSLHNQFQPVHLAKECQLKRMWGGGGGGGLQKFLAHSGHFALFQTQAQGIFFLLHEPPS